MTNANLLIEHGLEHTAVISFLKSQCPYTDLDSDAKRRLFSVSYNNLVDWSISIESDSVRFVYIRTQIPTVVEHYALSAENLSRLHSDAFEKIVERKPNPNVPALDDSFIKTISFWRRNISAELRYSVSNTSLSHLFNGIIFARALEDSHKSQITESPLLLPDTDNSTKVPTTIRARLSQAIGKFTNQVVPPYLFDAAALSPFDGLDPSTVRALLRDFYQNRFAPYPYDFSIMSKHALSRLYEHYVSLLREEDTPQLTLLPALPIETKDKSQGAIYTPQFIARFFARYLREQLPPFAFKRLRTIDPACGSGIFLRTILEFQCDPLQDGVTDDFVDAAFDNVVGIDRDENAAQATRLSLALLYLVLRKQLPKNLKVVAEDAIENYNKEYLHHSGFNVVMANPPFVSLDQQDQATRQRMVLFMGDDATGRIDTYLAFLKLGLRLLEPGGFGLFVLPHSFLLGTNAKKLRKLIAEEAWIRCLADLSAVRVFEDVGAYVILLIFQRRSESEPEAPEALIVQCHDMVAQALQDAVEGRFARKDAYSIFEVSQDVFEEENWLLLPPTEAKVKQRLTALPRLKDFVEIRQGVVTGDDTVFIVPAGSIPKGERAVFVPFLRDREIEAFAVPGKTGTYLFYPFLNGEKLDGSRLRKEFPGTWAYLSMHKARLSARKSLKTYKKEWWEPFWPRAPEHMMRPKIVTPHLVVVPRFALDIEGKYAVSHSPLMYPIAEDAGVELLRYLVAILNSTTCYWYVAAHSHQYQHGYTMLEKKTLAETPIPDPSKVSSAMKRKIIGLVESRLSAEGESVIPIGREIDRLVAELYGLTRDDRIAIGMDN
jgi:type I restriction-modification system DNA methylase subunit